MFALGTTRLTHIGTAGPVGVQKVNLPRRVVISVRGTRFRWPATSHRLGPHCSAGVSIRPNRLSTVLGWIVIFALVVLFRR